MSSSGTKDSAATIFFVLFLLATIRLSCCSAAFFGTTTTTTRQPSTTRTRPRVSLSSSSQRDDDALLEGLRVAIVGGGPSGLLLAHRILKSGGATAVDLYEKRPRPTEAAGLPESKGGGGRAYALGVGIRGRTAIQSVDQELWRSVVTVGYASERFVLQLGPLAIRLRDESDSISSDDPSVTVEPSLLLFQSDLCRTLADELERRWGGENGRLRMNWKCGVGEVDLESKTVVTETNERKGYDLIVGSDGVNSVVRKAIDEAWPAFNTTRQLIPGLFKVVKLPAMPPAIDPTAVQLLLPSSGAVTAFVEPTANGTCCVLFAGQNATDALLSSDNVTTITEALEARYPKLVGADLMGAAEQMAKKGKPSQASLVTCNTYHYDGRAVLVGDAAHATGGVSGQGVNSALVDAAVLADCLTQHYDSSNKQKSLGRALLAYSQRAVPEGKALYDLSFGPRPTSTLGKLGVAFASARDTIFKGRFGIGQKPIQTILTTSLRSFADIRRDRGRFYEEIFPEQAHWDKTLADLDATLEEELVA